MAFTGSYEDRLAIRELVDTYSDGVNQRDAEIWGSTWAEDAVWNLPVVPGKEEVIGKGAIVQSWLESMELFPFAFMSQSIGAIHIDGHSATARCYTSEVAKLGDGTELRPRGQYDDVLEKVDGQWLFVKRSFQVLYGE